jgi:hypothetical protein
MFFAFQTRPPFTFPAHQLLLNASLRNRRASLLTIHPELSRVFVACLMVV